RVLLVGSVELGEAEIAQLAPALERVGFGAERVERGLGLERRSVADVEVLLRGAALDLAQQREHLLVAAGRPRRLGRGRAGNSRSRDWSGCRAGPVRRGAAGRRASAAVED